MSTGVVIVAAGRGRRLGGETPKQYLDLAGRPVLRRAVEAFLSEPAVDAVVPVIHPDDRPLYDAALSGLSDPRCLPPAAGGETRAASVLKGLEALGALGANTPDKVLIHDAARPFVSGAVIGAVIAALEETDGAFAALPVVDALWREAGGMAEAPAPRERLWRAQTPQGFRFEKILMAHRVHDGSAADDVAVAREAGLAVRIVPGEERNYKITSAADYARAKMDAEGT